MGQEYSMSWALKVKKKSFFFFSKTAVASNAVLKPRYFQNCLGNRACSRILTCRFFTELIFNFPIKYPKTFSNCLDNQNIMKKKPSPKVCESRCRRGSRFYVSLSESKVGVKNICFVIITSTLNSAVTL